MIRKSGCHKPGKHALIDPAACAATISSLRGNSRPIPIFFMKQAPHEAGRVSPNSAQEAPKNIRRGSGYSYPKPGDARSSVEAAGSIMQTTAPMFILCSLRTQREPGD
jgi:hypothetical protein